MKCCFLFFIGVFVRCVVVLWLENLVVVMVYRLMVNRMIIVVSIVKEIIIVSVKFFDGFLRGDGIVWDDLVFVSYIGYV